MSNRFFKTASLEFLLNNGEISVHILVVRSILLNKRSKRLAFFWRWLSGWKIELECYLLRISYLNFSKPKY